MKTSAVTVNVTPNAFNPGLYDAWVTGGAHESKICMTPDDVIGFVTGIKAHYTRKFVTIDGIEFPAFIDYYTSEHVVNVVTVVYHNR